MADGNKGILLYFDMRDMLEALDDADRGKLLLALLNYGEFGEVPDFSGGLKIAFASVKPQIDKSIAAYKAKCEQNRENAKKRKATDSDCLRSVAVDSDGSQIKENKIKENKKRKNKKISVESPPIIPPDLADAFSDFAEMRKQIKAPLTDRATQLALSKLETLAPGDYDMQRKILEQSTMRSWRGLFELKDEGGAKHGQTVRVDENDTLSAMVF